MVALFRLINYRGEHLITQPYVTASLRIFGAGLDPSDVTKKLEVIPDYTHREGEHFRGNPQYAITKHGMWLINSKQPREDDLESHLNYLLSAVEPKLKILKMLEGLATVDFYCVLYDQQSFELSPSLLARVAALGATLGVVVYPEDWESLDASRWGVTIK